VFSARSGWRVRFDAVSIVSTLLVAHTVPRGRLPVGDRSLRAPP
jgi:hypothetical protein